MTKRDEQLEAMIEAALSERFPEVELVDFEVRGRSAPTLRLFIDREGGVDLDLCTAVSRTLDDLREQYTLEVSSPGLDRRLRKPQHFAAQIGREVALRTARPIDGRRNFRGALTAADEESVTLTLEDDRSVTLPLAELARAHVVYTHEPDGGERE